MTPSTPRFPALERVFRAYLHEDLAAEYGGPEAAMRAFRDDARRRSGAAFSARPNVSRRSWIASTSRKCARSCTAWEAAGRRARGMR